MPRSGPSAPRVSIQEIFPKTFTAAVGPGTSPRRLEQALRRCITNGTLVEVPGIIMGEVVFQPAPSAVPDGTENISQALVELITNALDKL